MKKILTLFIATILVTIGTVAVTATTPEFNQDQPLTTTVHNTPPEIIDGWIEILDQTGVLVWTSQDADGDGVPDGGPRGDPYLWESEKIVVYAIIYDINGESDLWQHTAQAFLSPEDIFVSELAIDYFIDPMTAVFKGEKFIPAPDIWQCLHDVYVTDTDKYGATSIPREYIVIDEIWINPYMTSTFTPAEVFWPMLYSCDQDVLADTNPHIEHVYAYCLQGSTEVPVTVHYELKIHGTDLEGSVHTSHVIPCENVWYTATFPDGNTLTDFLTNGEKYVGEFISCQEIFFDFELDVPCPIEPGDYHGEVNLAIKAI